MSFCPIRFQGQWEDGETGLYQNRFRYYEPLGGHYVSPDPIGILGGYREPSAYVSSPSLFFDGLGLIDSSWNGIPFNQQLSALQQAHPGVNFHFPSGTHTNATPGHWQSMLNQADEWAGSGNYRDIYLNQGINNEFGPGSISPNNRPDVMGVRQNGQIDMVEVPSNTDSPTALQDRMRSAQDNITRCCNSRGIANRAGTMAIRPPAP